MSATQLNQIVRRLPPAERVHTLVGKATDSGLILERPGEQIQVLAVLLSGFNARERPGRVRLVGVGTWTAAPESALNETCVFGATGPVVSQLELKYKGYAGRLDYTIIYAPRKGPQ